MLKIDQLRSLIQEELISASDSYMGKEKVRAELEKLIKLQIKSGKIKSQDALDDYFKTCEMALGALKMVPFEVWQKVLNKKKK